MYKRQFLAGVLGEDRAVYGATTGFGALVGYAGRADQRDQADNTLAHLGAGQGPDLDPDLARATLLVRAHSLARGASGVSPHVVDALVAALGTTFAPAMPRLGSVGASGDLIPLGAAAQALRGRGHAYLYGVRMPAGDALEKAGLEPLPLDGRDALALVNGTSLTTAATALALDRIRASHRVIQLLTCVLADLLGCDPQFLDAGLLTAYGHTGATAVGATMRSLLDGVTPSGTRPLQEPYSIRCTPQLLGAAEDALRYADGVVAADLASVSDNPLFFPGADQVVHGGNFFGQPAAFAADVLTMVLAQLGNLAELAAGPGLQHGLQGVQLASTALIAEIRRDAMPASIQSLPTNLHNQDIIPLGTQSALRALDQSRLLALITGSLALGLRQAVHVGARTPTAPACARLIAALADAIAPIDPDRPLEEDVRRAAAIAETLAVRSLCV